MGTYASIKFIKRINLVGKEIYNINDKLYHLTDDSWSMNGEHNWKLQ